MTPVGPNNDLTEAIADFEKITGIPVAVSYAPDGVLMASAYPNKSQEPISPRVSDSTLLAIWIYAFLLGWNYHLKTEYLSNHCCPRCGYDTKNGSCCSGCR